MRIMNKRFAKGFYGGKFLPFHKGHAYCIDRAAEMCDELYVILFYGGDDEKEAIKELSKDSDSQWYSVEARTADVERFCTCKSNTHFDRIDCRKMKKEAQEKGRSVWDAETPHVLSRTGGFDAVFSSEPSYSEYFERAYPFAEHVLIDVPRVNVPISGTKIRKMKRSEGKTWLAEK